MRRRILFISHSASINGAEKCLLDLLSGLDRKKYEPIVLLPEEGPLCGLIRALKIEIIIFELTWWIAHYERTRGHFKRAFLMMPKRIKYVRKIIRDTNIDLVYTNTITIIDGAIAAKLEKVPHIWHIHEIISRAISLKPYLPIRIIRYLVWLFSDRIITPAVATKEDISCCPDDRIEIVYNGIDLEKFALRKSKGDFRKEMDIRAETKLVALIGSIEKIKGHIDLIEAASIVCERLKDCIFIIVGEGSGSYKEFLKKRIGELGLSDRVRFVGYRSDIAGILEATDLLVSASWVESFPLSICEAMAAGKPVVATKCGGPEELVVDGETGLIVPIKSPKGIAEAIIKILVDENMSMEMGKGGKRRLMENFSYDKFVGNIERVIDLALIGSNSRSI